MNTPPQEVQDFVDARGRPAVFISLPNQNIGLDVLVQVRRALGDRQFNDLDVVIHSGGGDIHAAYLIAVLLRSHTKKTLSACVPLYAKSAATLLCIAADTIVLDEIAQLGPLDTQIRREERGGKVDYQSALNPFKTMAELRNLALTTLEDSVKLIADKSGLVVGESLEHAIRFVQATVGALFNQFPPDKLGDSSRALSIGSEYGYRLLRNREKPTEIIDRLVYQYPAHDYVIDYQELKNIGLDVLDVRCFDEAEQRTILPLISVLNRGDPIVECFEPESAEQPEQVQVPDAAGVSDLAAGDRPSQLAAPRATRKPRSVAAASGSTLGGSD